MLHFEYRGRLFVFENDTCAEKAWFVAKNDDGTMPLRELVAYADAWWESTRTGCTYDDATMENIRRLQANLFVGKTTATA